jgi:hypothetical protein
MKFLRKQEAIQYYNKHKAKQSLYLFQEDIDRAGSKCFHVDNIKKIYDNIIKLKKPHFYEFWTEDMPIKFGMDIDCKITEDMNTDELLIKIINIVIDSAKEYYDYEYNISDIIILENDFMEGKYSAHIIFCGLNFQNYLVVKDFFQRMNKKENLKSLFVDEHIYSKTCLRLFLNSKMNKNSILIPKKLYINDKFTSTCQLSSNLDNIYKFFLSTMITYTDLNDKMITIKNIQSKTITNQIKYKNVNENELNINLEDILMALPFKYYDEYDYWLKIGMILYQYNKLELWHKFSAMSEKYKSDEIETKWKSFENKNFRITIGTLIKWAKDENIKNIYINYKLELNNIVNKYPIKPIEINVSNLTEDNLTILSQAKLTPDIYTPVLNKKLIAIQSEKGTGKTSNLFETLFNNENTIIDDNTSILFISSRITFGYKLLGDLEEYGFELYSNIKEQHIYSKRIICQVDSLMRLEKDKYDIIIIDECETLARYITSTHFTKNPKANLIVSMLEMRIADANQVYIMDADLSDRCINYYSKIVNLKNMSDFHLIINNYKPYMEYTLIYSHYSTWLKKILMFIESDKKLVIAMASNAKAKDLNKKIIETFPEKKVLFIHKETTDEDKRSLLLNVNEEWIKYDIIIYTPSVCMGVSFDIINHFDNIFAYGCHESLGAQEWCQMIHRVRSPKNKEIFISIDNYKDYDEQEHNVDYTIVEKMLCSDYYLTHYDLHNNVIPKKITRIENIKSDLDKNIEESIFDISIGTPANEDKIIYYPYKNEPMYDLYVRNCWEITENKLNFAASFFGYVKFKEYKLEYLELNIEDNTILAEMKDIRKDRVDIENKDKIEGIFVAKDISNDEYNTKIKQRDEYLTIENMYEIYKYNLRKCYNKQDDIAKEFIEKYHDKECMKYYRNLSTILSTNTNTTEDKLTILKDNQLYDSVISNCYNEFTNKNKYTYHYYVIQIINMLGFNINDLSILIPYNEIIKKIEEVIKWCFDKKEELAFKYNLTIIRKSLVELKESEKLKYINSIICTQYGLKIKHTKNNNKEKINYKLDDLDKWNELKIVPIDLKSKKSNNMYDLDTSNLDLFIDE